VVYSLMAARWRPPVVDPDLELPSPSRFEHAQSTEENP
jgi:hypothetical protein